MEEATMARDSQPTIGMIGHGMMGVWHSENLAGLEALPHTAVGRRVEPTRAFADRFGYARATTDMAAMLADPEIDAVIVASPSEAHVDHSLAAIAAGKHVLIEIPIAMDLAGAERVAAAAAGADKVVAVCHPWRHRPEMVRLKERFDAGNETLGCLEGRFLIHRLENIGATGYQRSWTDNILWHHGCHLVDLACWLMGPSLETTGTLAPVDPRTGTPMTTQISLARPDGAAAHILLTYLSHLKQNEATVSTDQDSYRIDIPNAALVTKTGSTRIEPEQTVCRHVLADFVEACRTGRRPRVTPADVLPAMAALQTIQDGWDARHGAQSLRGRTLEALG
jgi:2-hydroxy-4-carboxymuconate semialdehyde hemiacetal dehydrogenase